MWFDPRAAWSQTARPSSIDECLERTNPLALAPLGLPLRLSSVIKRKVDFGSHFDPLDFVSPILKFQSPGLRVHFNDHRGN